jgi:hypothetical protein
MNGTDGVIWLWPTRIYHQVLDSPSLGKVGLTALRQQIESVSRPTSVQFEPKLSFPEIFDYVQNIIPTHIRYYLGACGESTDESRFLLSLTGQFLSSHTFRTYTYSRGRYHAIFYLDCVHNPDSERRSGKILLRDPRTGCANVFFPGLPLGRPLLFDPRPGMLIIFPSYVQFSITPLSPGDWQLFIEMEIKEYSQSQADSNLHII